MLLYFLIWCSLCLLFICWASVEFVLEQILLRCVILSFFFLEELVFFFFTSSFFFPPYKSLCSRSEIIISPSDLCFSLYSFISSRYDHNFIPVYWTKFIRKAKTKRNRLNLKSWSWFTESGGQTAIHVGPYFFCMERFFTLNKL